MYRLTNLQDYLEMNLFVEKEENLEIQKEKDEENEKVYLELVCYFSGKNVPAMISSGMGDSKDKVFETAGGELQVLIETSNREHIQDWKRISAWNNLNQKLDHTLTTQLKKIQIPVENCENLLGYQNLINLVSVLNFEKDNKKNEEKYALSFFADKQKIHRQKLSDLKHLQRDLIKQKQDLTKKKRLLYEIDQFIIDYQDFLHVFIFFHSFLWTYVGYLTEFYQNKDKSAYWNESESYFLSLDKIKIVVPTSATSVGIETTQFQESRFLDFVDDLFQIKEFTGNSEQTTFLDTVKKLFEKTNKMVNTKKIII